MAPVRKAVVIVAFPRSGTHIVLDFIRRNFPAFNRRLWPWESARGLYVGLDRPGWRDDLGRQMAQTDHILVQSHRAGVLSSDDEAAIEAMRPDEVVFLYPFRSFASTLRSFAELCAYPGPVESFLGESCAFLHSERTVASLARLHGERWLERQAACVDVETMAADPDRAAERLGALLGLEPRALGRRMPRRRPFHGALAEAVQRVTGRESTEVRAPRHKGWAHPGESGVIDARFADLHARLAARSLV